MREYLSLLSNNKEIKSPRRDNYIDFLRGFGLLLLVVAHTWAPLTLTTIRTFDVPLMVMISAMCYKPVKRDFVSIKKYLWKRFLRIYVPVFIFVNLFFVVIMAVETYIGKNIFSVYQYIGSLFLLNTPSIGYVWIMRVFLMMALVLPFIEPLFKKLQLSGLIISLFTIICLQEAVINGLDIVPAGVVKFMLSEIIPYLIGYTIFTAIGLKINQLTASQRIILIVTGVLACSIYIWCTGNYFPQEDKYPPHGLYLLWGWSGSCILVVCKSIIGRVASWSIWDYLSRNSMWLYLWHIIPVYFMLPISLRPEVWIVRYIIALGGAVILNFLYHLCIVRFPKGILKYIS